MPRIHGPLTEKKPEERIYPVFLPHAGCPFRCVYCNQNAVTAPCGPSESGTAQDILRIFRLGLDRLTADARRCGIAGEISFYGGTFTSLPIAVLRQILDTVNVPIKEGLFTGIRFSTRPDALTEPCLELLSDYPVRTVELGVQSLSETVLERSRRGYGVRTVERACAAVRARGWRLGLQLMPGLPGDTCEVFLESLRRTIGLGPEFVRLYPTLVLKDTTLADWYRAGSYRPLSLEEAVRWCARAYAALREAHVPTARMGLQADPELEKPGVVLAGPYHPAFGYLVKSRYRRDRILELVRFEPEGVRTARLTAVVHDRVRSEVLGPSRENVEFIEAELGLERFNVRAEKDRDEERIDLLWD
ncbi:Radical SAM domain protein [Syntrophobacter fumaroxidans MPOB]|uniref:Radical SAM domain protein n=1 Tax=Syntrophobacter fumaroxidans (strain DSM 10017 / MPOB) TaxID=335543 RepID=A0LGM0_SYNFM|nr:Radical SAM domain protein [Syntrophobacter fumaroxidans MPOB]